MAAALVLVGRVDAGIDRLVGVGERADPSPYADQVGAVRLWAVLDEAVLRRPMGSRAVLREQVESLLEQCDHPSVRPQVIPFGRGGHAAAGGAFTILRFPLEEMPDTVYIEHLTGALYLDRAEDVDRYTGAASKLIIEAEPPDRTPDIPRETLRKLA